jgi:oxygen-independent coproporphyrinogen-3 oxidase
VTAAARRLPMFPARLEESTEEVAGRAQAGPRYTSYPPATQFRDDFGPAEAAAQLAAIPREAPLSLYGHIPFCSQLCWYCGCNVTATRDRSKGSVYVDRLIRELQLVAGALGRWRPLAELAFGGGSPNFLDDRDLVRLVGAVCSHFALTEDAELGIELDPRDTTGEKIDVLGDVGFTRLSVGVQDFDPFVQETIHRAQTVAQTRAVIDRARSAGFRSVNVDLVYGLPGQSPATLRGTLDEVARFAPDRVAVFGYAHLPHLRPHQKLVERAAPVPDLPLRVELLRTVMDGLADAGYVRIGLDHFARPGDPLVEAARTGRLGRNFQGYVVRRAEHLIGVGASAISDSRGAYWQNTVDVDDWARAVDGGTLPVARGVGLDADDELRRAVIMTLMCEGRLDFAEVEARHGIRFADTFAEQLRTLEDRHRDLAVVDRDAGTIVATPLGHHLIRNLAVVFDRYARPGAGGSPTI